MTDKGQHAVELKDQLLDQPDRMPECQELIDLFSQDNVNDFHAEDTKVSISLHLLQKRHGGTENLARSLNSNVKTGIEGSAQDIISRAERYGSNKQQPRKIKTLWELVIENFEDTILQILCVAAVVSLAIGVWKDGWAHGWIDGSSIMLAIVIITAITAGNNYIKEKQFQELQQKQDEATAIVIRNGHTTTIDAEELVVGDLIQIENGKTLPADAILVTSIDMTASEGSLTGESIALNKEHLTPQNYEQNPNPFLLGTTLIQTGTGRAIVGCVGPNTRAGQAERILDIESELTPLQKKLETIANQIGTLGVYVAILTFIAMTVRLLVAIFYANERDLTDKQNLTDLLDAFIIAVTVVVVAVPEGLPLAVTISLAFSVSKMQKEHNMVRRLHASETMGGANEICTDKTGTLTKNEMSVMAMYLEDKIVEGTRNADLKNTSVRDLVAECVIFNSSAHIEIDGSGRQVALGNVTEKGIFEYLMNSDVDAYTLQGFRDNEGFLELSIPFSSERKRQTTAIRHHTEENKIRVYVKGAPEAVIESCSRTYGAEGVVDLEEEKKFEILSSVVKPFAERTFRTILIAYKDYDLDEWNTAKAENNDFIEVADRSVVENDLTLIGIFALVDPLRPGIKASVELCQRAGITVRMCTGDNIDTAKAISKEAGILTNADLEGDEDGYVCMIGKDFRDQTGGIIEQTQDDGTTKLVVKNKRKFRAIADKLRVLARSLPEDKFLLVTGLKEMDQTVAVTGDGTNDAPALNKADVGFAMGITGTDVAKNASDIILTDDNFCSIETAIKYGRNIYDNVRKFLQFQLTVNVAAMFIVFSGAVLFSEAPLTSVQMLWVNLIMDTFAALALATEPPSDDLFQRTPAKRTDKIVNEVMWRNIFGQGIMQIVVLMVMLFFGQDIWKLPYEKSTPFYVNQEYLDDDKRTQPELLLDDITNKTILFTMIFQTFVFMQLFNQINARKLGEKEYNVFKGFCNNWIFLLVTVITFIVQVAIVEYGGRSIRAAPLSWEQNYWCLGIGAFSLLWGLVVKAVLPAKWFDKLSMNEKEMDDEEEAASSVAHLRKSFRQSTMRRGNTMTQSSKLA